MNCFIDTMEKIFITNVNYRPLAGMNCFHMVDDDGEYYIVLPSPRGDELFPP